MCVWFFWMWAFVLEAAIKKWKGKKVKYSSVRVVNLEHNQSSKSVTHRLCSKRKKKGDNNRNLVGYLCVCFERRYKTRTQQQSAKQASQKRWQKIVGRQTIMISSSRSRNKPRLLRWWDVTRDSWARPMLRGWEHSRSAECKKQIHVYIRYNK